jgi:peptide/nickel transport system ATP-binding protein
LSNDSTSDDSVASQHYDIIVRAGNRPLLDIHGFHLREGQITLLFGESGIGKSLLGKTIAGLLPVEELHAEVNGEPYHCFVTAEETVKRREHGFFVFQEPSTHLNPLMTLQEQVQEGDLRHAPNAIGAVRELWDDHLQRDVDALLPVYPKPYRPSGGEKQRMILAMALAKLDLVRSTQARGATTLFIFDEPTSSLDNAYRDRFLRSLFRRYREHRTTILLITHDYSIIGEVATHHRDLLGDTSFQELTLQHGKHVLREFLPSQYTRWLNELQPLAGQTSESRSHPASLKVSSGVIVQDRVLSFTREDGEEEVPLEVERGGFVYLKAPSGAGKTTLVKTIMGLTSPQRFQMVLGGREITEKSSRRLWRNELWGQQLTMVFQHADESLNPRASVRESFRGLPLPAEVIKRRLDVLLHDLFDADVLDEIMDRPVGLLSGGQKQRVNLLRSMLLDADFLILDEPLNGLDFDSFRTILGMVKHKVGRGTGILLISHNEEIFDRLIPPRHRYHLHPVRTEEGHKRLRRL